MRVAILTSNDLRHDYFCLSLIKSFNVVGIIREPKGPGKTGLKIQKKPSRNRLTFNFIVSRIIGKLYGKYMVSLANEKKHIETRYFRDTSVEFRKKYNKVVIAEVDKVDYNSINDEPYVEQLIKLKPDVTAVMGTSLLKEDILSVGEYNLNMHTGVSPYYRGGRTNFWPIRFKEAQYCGVTIHKLNLGIDSGDIIYHGLPIVDDQDNFPKINCKAIMVGTDLMKKSLSDLENGKLCGKKQWIKGKVYSDRDFNGWHAYRYYMIMKDGYFKKYVDSLKKNKIMYPDGLVLNHNHEISQYIPYNYR